jgi:hypothetical protein
VGVIALSIKAMVDVFLSPLWATEWYSFPQRTAFNLAVVMLALSCFRLHSMRLTLIGAVFVISALATRVPYYAADEKFAATKWQVQGDATATWIRLSGPAGIYGSPDAGLLGFELDNSGRKMVNLDGLVNSYDYAAALERRAPALDRYRSQGLGFLVARRDLSDRWSVPACALPIWRSSADVQFDFNAFQFEPSIDAPMMPIRVWDLRPCG